MDDISSRYEIPRTAEFLRGRAYTRVALQFPDELLKDAAPVARALRRELGGGGGTKLYVMADTAYNSCCVDEVGASAIDAQCVVHYGHSCMSPTSNLPAFFVFGKAPVDINACCRSLLDCSRESDKPILVLCGLEYSHALDDLKEATVALCNSDSHNYKIQYADVLCSEMSPSSSPTAEEQCPESNESTHNDDLANFVNSCCNVEGSMRKYNLGGLTWGISIDEKMDDYLLYWIGEDNSAFANVALTFNKCDIGASRVPSFYYGPGMLASSGSIIIQNIRYDAVANQLSRDVSHLMKILRRRYYLVEKAKDASIVGILVGTLGVAGYLHIIEQMKNLIKAAGKKSYTLVMGRPNSAKLANFPECEVFVYVSCAQTALLDSKEFLAPVITPFEAVLAFSRGREWTGEYLLDFKDLITSEKPEVASRSQEARFSFIKGGYVEDDCSQENEENPETSLALAELTEKALSVRNQNNDAVLYQGGARSAIDYLKARSYQGLTGEYERAPDSVLIGRTGRAAGYSEEKTKSSQ